MKHLLKIFCLLVSVLSLLHVDARAANQVDVSADQANVIVIVKKAGDYIQKHGKEKAIIEFKKNAADIFMGDYSGNFYLSPLHPELVGTKQFNYQDAYGALPVQEEIEKAKAESRWWLA